MTLEEAKREAAKALIKSLGLVYLDPTKYEQENGWKHYIPNITQIILAFERSGYVLCNKTLTMDQRNKMSDAFHNNFQSMQAVHDVMLKGVK